MEARGAAVHYHDPHVPVIPPTREHGYLAGRVSQALDREALRGADLALVVTDHDAIDWDVVADHARLVVDTRNVMKRASGRSAIVVAA